MEFSNRNRKNSARGDKTEVIGYTVAHRRKSRKGERARRPCLGQARGVVTTPLWLKNR
jgi:hypothetical protein